MAFETERRKVEVSIACNCPGKYNDTMGCHECPAGRDDGGSTWCILFLPDGVLEGVLIPKGDGDE